MNNTARNFALQLGALISLYLSLSFLLVLIFGVTNLWFPDDAESYWAANSAQSSVKIGIAMVVVFFPAFLILTRRVNQIRRTETEGSYLGLTKWLIYLSLLVGGGVLLGDLVAVIMTFLEGEITERFVIKAMAVLVVIGAAFYYYLMDARGYWIAHEKQSVWYGIVMSAIVLTSLSFGYTMIDTPFETRERRLDERQVQDLREIQWRIVDVLNQGETLPERYEELFAGEIITAPEGRAPYEYMKTTDGFMLCATFAFASDPDEYGYSRPYVDLSDKPVVGESFEHGAGKVCFDRKVNFPE